MAASLIEFQRNLIARLQRAEHVRARQAHLGFQAGGRNWLAEMKDITEVLPMPGLLRISRSALPRSTARSLGRGSCNIFFGATVF